MRKNNCMDCGKNISIKAKRCKSCCQKGILNINYGKNIPSSMKGKKLSKEQIEKNRIALIKAYSEGKIVAWNKGKKWSEEVRQKMKKSWKYDKHMTKEARLKMSLAQKRLYLEGKKNKCIGALGKENLSWRGGKKYEPYDNSFNKKFKKIIKERDMCCMLCNLSLEDIKILKRQIDIHHIDYNKLNSTKENCITLCNQCHPKTNPNRKQWTQFFQSLLSERYGYNYSEGNLQIFDIVGVSG